MVIAVAKKKIESKQESGSEPKGKPGPKPDPARVRSEAVMLRGRPEWKEWLGRLAEFDRAPSMNELFDRAITAYARDIGFKEAAPKR